MMEKKTAEKIKDAYDSLSKLDKRFLKKSVCAEFGYKDRNFQTKMANKSWSIMELKKITNILIDFKKISSTVKLEVESIDYI